MDCTTIDPPEYYGVTTCEDCHDPILEWQDVNEFELGHLKFKVVCNDCLSNYKCDVCGLVRPLTYLEGGNCCQSCLSEVSG